MLVLPSLSITVLFLLYWFPDKLLYVDAPQTEAIREIYKIKAAKAKAAVEINDRAEKMVKALRKALSKANK